MCYPPLPAVLLVVSSNRPPWVPLSVMQDTPWGVGLRPSIWVDSIGPPVVVFDPLHGVPPRTSLSPASTMTAGPTAPYGISSSPRCRPPPPLPAACRRRLRQRHLRDHCLFGAVFVARLLPPFLVGTISVARSLTPAPLSPRPRLPSAASSVTPLHWRSPPAILLHVQFSVHYLRQRLVVLNILVLATKNLTNVVSIL